MYIFAALFLCSFACAKAMPDMTKEEWKTGIEQLFSNITKLYDTKEFDSERDYFTEDFQGFHPGAMEGVGFDGLDLSRHYIKIEEVKVRWAVGNFAVSEFEVHQESSKGVKQLEHGLAVIVEEDGKLKMAFALWNFVYA